VKNLLIEKNYKQNETILIGDSINDYEVSKINNIDFYGYNNLELENVSKLYLINYKELER
jgi:phosphoglycolate phosphatase-like HAD superfamily hydrolase